MNWRVQFAPGSLAQLQALDERILESGVPLAAKRYVDAIVGVIHGRQDYDAARVSDNG
jgi:hypothetical protein